MVLGGLLAIFVLAQLHHLQQICRGEQPRLMLEPLAASLRIPQLVLQLLLLLLHQLLLLQEPLDLAVDR